MLQEAGAAFVYSQFQHGVTSQSTGQELYYSGVIAHCAHQE